MQYRKTAIALLAATATVVAAVSPASAAWRHRHHHGWGWGGAGIGFATGALVGSALASPYYYGGRYAYGPGPYVVDEGPYAAAPRYSSDDAYCSRRFKSYDPSSGTYLGYDGERHPCP